MHVHSGLYQYQRLAFREPTPAEQKYDSEVVVRGWDNGEGYDVSIRGHDGQAQDFTLTTAQKNALLAMLALADLPRD